MTDPSTVWIAKQMVMTQTGVGRAERHGRERFATSAFRSSSSASAWRKQTLLAHGACSIALRADCSCNLDQAEAPASTQPYASPRVDIGTHGIVAGFYVDVPMPALATMQATAAFRGDACHEPVPYVRSASRVLGSVLTLSGVVQLLQSAEIGNWMSNRPYGSADMESPSLASAGGQAAAAH